MPEQTILIIDDSPDIHELVQLGLAGEPVDFMSCFSGEEGLAAALMLGPDLILLDVEMAGLDGFEVCRQLKSNPLTADAPIIFLTGAVTTEEKLRGLDAGATDYVFKPFDPAELRARVRASLNTKRLMDLLEQKALTLQQSEERFRLLAENSSDVISRRRADGYLLYVSPASTAIVGYTPEELVGQMFFDFINPDDAAEVAACYETSHRTGSRGTVAYRFRKRSGQYLWLESTCQVLSDPLNGDILEIHASTRDISARKRMECRERLRAHALEMIMADRPLDSILSLLIDAAEREHPDAAAAGVMLLGSLALHFAPTLPSNLSVAIERNLYDLAQRFDVLGTQSSDRIIVCDLLNDPAWNQLRPLLEQAGVRSCWSILIRSLRGSAGVFTLYRRDQLAPSAPDSEMLRLAADLTGIAVEHRQLTDQLTFAAQNDTLTQLPNRALFADRLQQALASSMRSGRPAAVLLIDVDRFKQINDTYGHQAGDELLCEVAHRLKSRLRSCDTLARMGGDEFAVIIGDLSSAADVQIVAQSLVEEFKKPIALSGREMFVTITCGSATYPADGHEPALLLKHADLALYAAKDAGRNGFKQFTAEMSAGAIDRMELENALRQAPANGALRLHYQPKVDRANRIVGLEALLRWQHPELGLVLPDKFISVAEESGLIVPLGRWVLDEAARQARQWVAMGLPVIPISVNVSTIEFSQPDFIRSVSSALEASGLKTRWLELELTETLLMGNMRDAVDKLHRLKQLQIGVAIDDFGTGYSSLAYLQRLPLDTLKVDQSFTRSIDSPGSADNGRAIISAIVALAKSLNLSVVAEGVETDSQRNFLFEVGCDIVQGFLFSPPREAEDIAPMLLEQLQRNDKALPLCA